MDIPYDIKKLEEILRSPVIVSQGFLGHDRRSLFEIVDTDLAQIKHLGYTTEQIADRMEELSIIARKGLGTSVTAGKNLVVSSQEHRGMIICPWPHDHTERKCVTSVTHVPSGTSVQWSDLCIHLIRSHAFFQGYGSPFRLDPEKLIPIIFTR